MDDRRLFAIPQNAGAGMIMYKTTTSGNEVSTAAPRNFFPETWLWDLNRR